MAAAFLGVLCAGLAGHAGELQTFSIELPNTEADVIAAVRAVADDHVIHGTYVYEREKILGEAGAETSSVYFGPWKNEGQVFYKVRRNALAPRNFKNSSDIGVISVRYVVHGASEGRTRLEIVAVFVEDGTHRVHESTTTVESSEFAEIQNQLLILAKEREQAAAIQQKRDSEAAQATAVAQQRREVAERDEVAESSLKAMERRADELQHAVEVRVPAADTELKSAPFRSATTLTKMAANSDVLVEIITPYWYGVETADGHRGWVPRDQVVPLP
jgi:hypothetical protein